MINFSFPLVPWSIVLSAKFAELVETAAVGITTDLYACEGFSIHESVHVARIFPRKGFWGR
jgi:hypothetical protein